MPHWIRNHSISIPLLVLCVLCLVAQSVTGYFNYNEQQQQHHQSLITYAEYVINSDYWETVFENFEGEFISLAAYTLLTSYFIEKGAKESRQPGQKTISDATQRQKERQKEQVGKQIPWAEKAGQPVRWLFQHSIFLVFLLLFILSIVGHAIAGVNAYNSILTSHNQSSTTMAGYLTSPLFWLQSVRNWQAGFLSTGLLVAFSIFLRQRGSPTSKTLDQSNEETGETEE